MSHEKETFTSEELAAWRKVNRIKAEINAEIESEGQGAPEPEKKKSVSDDPRDAWMADQRRLREERERKPNYTDEERKMMKDLVNRSR
jgi:hypothetical protein